MAPARAGFGTTLRQAVLDGLVLAILSLPVVAFFLGSTLGVLIQALLFAAYAGMFWSRRSVPAMLAAVFFAALASGVFFVAFGRRRTRPQGPPPTPMMLAVMRSALLDFRAQHKGAYPSRLDDLIPQYTPSVPEIQAAHHRPTAISEYYGAEVCTPEGLEPSHLRDSGKWGYVNDPRAPCWGWVFIDCIHLDSEGKPYYGY